MAVPEATQYNRLTHTLVVQSTGFDAMTDEERKEYFASIKNVRSLVKAYLHKEWANYLPLPTHPSDDIRWKNKDTEKARIFRIDYEKTLSLLPTLKGLARKEESFLEDHIQERIPGLTFLAHAKDFGTIRESIKSHYNEQVGRLHGLAKAYLDKKWEEKKEKHIDLINRKYEAQWVFEENWDADSLIASQFREKHPKLVSFWTILGNIKEPDKKRYIEVLNVHSKATKRFEVNIAIATLKQLKIAAAKTFNIPKDKFMHFSLTFSLNKETYEDKPLREIVTPYCDNVARYYL